MRKLKYTLVILFIFLLLTSQGFSNSLYAKANNKIVVSGLIGNVSWSLTASGDMTITGGQGMQFSECKPVNGSCLSPWDGDNDSPVVIPNNTHIKTITFTGPVTARKDSSSFFNLSWLEKINNLSFLDTSNTVNMSKMFANTSLTSLDLSTFNTSHVTNMSNIFADTETLTSLDLSTFNTSHVTNMSGMFSNSALTTIDLSNFDTSSVTDMSWMFSDYNIDIGAPITATSLDLSKFNTSHVTNMSYMFTNLRNLESLDLSNFDTSNVTDMSYMFAGLLNLKSLDLSSFNTSKVKNMNAMFEKMKSLTSLNISNFNMSNVQDIGNMFNTASKLKILDLNKWNTKSLTDIYSAFSNCTSLKTLNISKWNTSKLARVTYDDDDGDRLNIWSGGAFNNTPLLKSLNVSKWNTSKVTDMSGLFQYSGVKKLNVSKWNTSKVTDMSNMFYNSGIKSLDISKWNTKKVRKDGFTQMFQNAKKLSSIKLGKNTKFLFSKGTKYQPTLSNLPNIKKTKKWTGAWVGKKTGKVYKNSATFIKQYTKKPIPDTYIWQTR